MPITIKFFLWNGAHCLCCKAMECELKLLCHPSLKALCGWLILCLKILRPKGVIILVSNSSATHLSFEFAIVAYLSGRVCSYSYVPPGLTNSWPRYDPTIIWNESGWSSNRRNTVQKIQRDHGVFHIPRAWLVGRQQDFSLAPRVWRHLKGGRINLQPHWRTDNYQGITQSF